MTKNQPPGFPANDGYVLISITITSGYLTFTENVDRYKTISTFPDFQHFIVLIR